MTDLANRVVLVTGASSGIGAAIATQVLERGGMLISAALDRADFGPEYDNRVHHVQVDLGDCAAIGAAMEAIPERFRAIDALINCAGHDAGGRVRFDKMTREAIVGIISVNLIGTMIVTHLALPALIQSGRGHIINIGSISAKEAIPTIAAYSASKHGVHGFTDSLRVDLAGTGVKVTEVVPGKTRTNFATARWHGDTGRGAAYYDDSPRGCLTAEDVAKSVVWALEQPSGVMISELVILPVPAGQDQ